MTLNTVIYMDCDHCGNVIPYGSMVHSAMKREYRPHLGGVFIDETKHLCCSCFQFVGGDCNGSH